MDLITKNIFDNYVKSEKLMYLGEDKQFEFFSNSLVMKYNDLSGVELADISTGKNAKGIDGIIITVNGNVTVSEIDTLELIKKSNSLKVEFYFIQSKRSNSFDNKDMLNFFHWSKEVFDFNNETTDTEEMMNFISIIKCIYDNANKFECNPTLNLYYICTGEWDKQNENLNNIIRVQLEELTKMNIFNDVISNICGTKEIQEMYRNIKKRNEATFIVEDSFSIALNENNTTVINAAVTFENFKTIFIDEKHNLRKVFDDNVRSYLGLENATVNKDIYCTLIGNNPEYFYILNNGITIVAESCQLTAKKLVLRNYQIVNGCQSCHVLYECDNENKIDKIKIPIRIIATENLELKNNIVRSTNNQTQIKIEQLQALTDFQKGLESYYDAARDKYKINIYYARRDYQFSNSDIADSQIISIELQMKSYYSIFGEKPEVIANSYGTLKDSLGKDIFVNGHTYIEYYISGLAYYKVLNMFNEKKIDRDMWKFRYHILYALKYVVMKRRQPESRQKEYSEYCEEFLQTLLDDSICEICVNDSVKIVQKIYDIEKKQGKRKIQEKKSTTEGIEEMLKEEGCMV